jgi:hypothetical protein
MIKKNIRDSFILICVDNRSLNIPQFVDKVPMIVINARSNMRQIITDENLIHFLEDGDNTGSCSEEIQPFLLNANMNSSQYSFITADGNDYVSENNTLLNEQNVNFIMLGKEQIITTPHDRESNERSKNDNKDDGFEKLMNARKFDDEMYKQKPR